MSFRIIADSSSDLTPEMKKNLSVETVPLILTLGNESFVDNETLDVNDFIKKMNAYSGQAMSSCPSPDAYMEKYTEGSSDTIFVVTLSSQLSGSFNSAQVAKGLIEGHEEEIHVFDSKSASAGQLLICMKIREFIDQGLDKNEIIKQIEGFIKNMKTFFVLKSLDNLIKNGRMSKINGLVAGLLHIFPILGSDGNGNITLFSKVKGMRRAIEKLAEIIGETCKDTTNRILTITHCNNPEYANMLKKIVQEKYLFKDILIASTKGLSSMYANEGGIIIAF